MTIQARSIMTRDVVTARPEDSVARVARLLSEHGISAVPVCDQDGKLLGMVSEGDLMRPFIERNALRRAWWLGLLAEGTDLAPEFLDYIRLDHRRAQDVMTQAVVAADEDTGVPEIAGMLARHAIKRVPVVRDGRLVGIVSRADIVRVLAQKPEAIVAGPL
jgi:CBS domain-containing protein